jgi:hypothetical protein
VLCLRGLQFDVEAGNTRSWRTSFTGGDGRTVSQIVVGR